jgi:hypothetical protein
MKEIPLTQGMVALVDDEDFERLSQYKWYAWKSGNAFYATRNITLRKGVQGQMKMHREILNLTDRKIYCDHINHNGLDNQKHNLRACTSSENQMNTISKTGVSQYKGVCWYKQGETWAAQIMIHRKRIHLGCYDSEEDAAKAYDEAAKLYFGEFACLNFNKKEEQLCQI